MNEATTIFAFLAAAFLVRYAWFSLMPGAAFLRRSGMGEDFKSPLSRPPLPRFADAEEESGPEPGLLDLVIPEAFVREASPWSAGPEPVPGSILPARTRLILTALLATEKASRFHRWRRMSPLPGLGVGELPFSGGSLAACRRFLPL